MADIMLKGIDFSNCELEGICVRIEDLFRGIVSLMQTVSISSLLGIIVK